MSDFANLPQFEAGCRMPTKAAIDQQDRARISDAEIGSAMLLDAINRYHRNRVAEMLSGHHGMASLLTACAVVRGKG